MRYEEIYELSPMWNGGELKWHHKRQPDYRFRENGYGFRCCYCRAFVHTLPMLAGVKNRNHCPYCLWSRHVDLLQAGDRMSACKAIMQPIGLTVKQGRNKYGNYRSGELMLIHRCYECGKLSTNRIAADDIPDQLMDIFQASAGLDAQTQHQLEASGIRLLQGEDANLVISQLRGIAVN